MKKHITIAVALAFVSGYSFAAELSITKSVKPDRVVTAKSARAIPCAAFGFSKPCIDSRSQDVAKC